MRDFYRRAKSRGSLAKKYTGLPKTTAAGGAHEAGYDQVELLDRAMDLLMSALPPYVARVVIERYVRAKSLDEIALELGIEKRSVSRYCCVGLKHLRHLLDD